MAIEIDITKILLALFAALPPTLLALAAWRESRKTTIAVEEVQKSINGRMSELLKSSKAESLAEGKEFEKKETEKKETEKKETEKKETEKKETEKKENHP